MKLYIIGMIGFLSIIAMTASIYYMDDRDKEE